ncbi:protein zyg-11 homolog B [Petromyzon marinus]|uniref:Protein zyg-11 homolog B n=1 Tax=Petromyzon marinus TaxID=7757 RepID=A0AAJ7X9V1_PETMA|nr:protein zyg-11 homolog B [Petromyzon marinus]
MDEGSPESLLDLCLGSLCWNLESMCTTAPDGLLCLREHVVFPQELADRLLKKLALADQLTDHTVAVFRNTRALRVRRACVRSARLSAQAFERSLARHPLVELDARGVNADITVMDVVRALTGARRGYTQPPAYNQTLERLAVDGMTLSLEEPYELCLGSLRALRCLSVRNVLFFTEDLREVAQLPCLESLDISNTCVTELWPLSACAPRLRSLSMYHLKRLRMTTSQVLEVLEELAELRHLDISDDKQFTSDVASRLLTRTHALPHLVSLDMSGRAGIADDALLAFRHAHPGMHFLGLLATDAGYAPFLSGDGTLKVTGEANENQITEALRRYGDRAFFIREALYHLFSRTPNLNQPRPDLLKLVADGMQSHSKNLAVQIAASACVFNLSKQELAAAMPVRLLSRVVAHTLAAMTQFPNHQQLQKNCLLSLCSDRILQDVPFDRFQAAKLVMQWLCNHDDQNMQRMAVAIISILAAKLSTEQTALLGSELLIVKKLLHIVEQKTAASAIDTTLKFTLSALWNLTDESPTTCRHFIDNQGLELFMRVLETFPTDPSVQQKVLGLLNNIAEVTELHPQLMRKGFIEHIGSLLSSGEVEVSYFAAGIIAHLTYRGEAAWRLEPRLRATLLQQLQSAILGWTSPDCEMVAYRSFSPFFPLLKCADASAVQLWAVWAMQHVCSKNPGRYCSMLLEEGGRPHLVRLQRCLRTARHVRAIAASVLQRLDAHATACAAPDS